MSRLSPADPRRVLGVVVALTLLGGACGSSDDGSGVRDLGCEDGGSASASGSASAPAAGGDTGTTATTAASGSASGSASGC